uniref:HEAT repeat domain-containing protein n=1 Tax=Schlesneria paludicola TaxID=360056 RepID=A0A7C2PFQ2_9PLAN
MWWRMTAALLVGLAGGCGGNELSRALADLTSQDYEQRRMGAHALFELRPDRPDVVAALIQAGDDPDSEVRRWACRALGELTSAEDRVVTVLEARLRDPETAVRRAAAFALHKRSPESTAYRTELLAAVTEGDGGVIVALGTLQPRPTWAIPALVKSLQDRRPGLRRLAAECLGQLGAWTPEVRQALDRACQDADDRVRSAASEALARLQLPPENG